MRYIVVLLSVLLLAAGSALAADYRYVSPETVKTWIETDKPVTIVDIQVKEEFESHHIPGSIATYSYPVKTDQEKARIGETVSGILGGDEPVVVVCPRGGGGAKRCYDYLKAQSVPEERLLILEKGMEGWPYKDLTESVK